VRQKLSRTITKNYENKEGVLPIITLEQKLEDTLREKIQRGEQGSYLVLEPTWAQRLLAAIKQTWEQSGQMGYPPVLLCSSILRRHLKRLLERFMPQVAVLGHNEIAPSTKIKSLGTVSLDYAD
jgi:flagellar biosynthesis protein FlhA